MSKLVVELEDYDIPEDLSVACMAIVDLMKQGATGFTITTDTGAKVEVTMKLLEAKP